MCIKVCQIGILFVKLAIGPFDEERRLSNEEDQIINWFGKPLTECTGPSVELVRRRRVVRPDIIIIMEFGPIILSGTLLTRYMVANQGSTASVNNELTTH